MLNFLKMVLAASCGQIIIWIIARGFEESYWGRNSREEITRFFDKFSKHVQKLKKGK
ncbi:MAG: hypothetical protein ACTSYZ_12595 [Candidatus Helarchaeota archaeon]